MLNWIILMIVTFSSVRLTSCFSASTETLTDTLKILNKLPKAPEASQDKANMVDKSGLTNIS